MYNCDKNKVIHKSTEHPLPPPPSKSVTNKVLLQIYPSNSHYNYHRKNPYKDREMER